MALTNFWISTALLDDSVFRLAGHNRAGYFFEITVKKYPSEGLGDFHNEQWHEGSFLVGDGSELWHVEVSLAEESFTASTEAVPDDEFRYDKFGMSTIVFSSVTGAIVANL